MAREHFPKLGDVVLYESKRMVIVDIESNGSIAYPIFFYSFLDESLIKDIPFMETEELKKECKIKRWCPDSVKEEPPFPVVDSETYKINKQEYTTITK